MKMSKLFLLMSLPLIGKQHIPRVQDAYALGLEYDMNQIPIAMDETLYKMSCADIKKNNVAIKVLQDELHTYMIRTDAMMLKLNKLEAVVMNLQVHRPWYKRLFSKK